MSAPLSGGGRRFSDIPEISPATLAVLQAAGFTCATPVQDAVIPLFARNTDVAVDACTGSGKTLAFVIPLVEKLRQLEEPLKKHQVGALIISPTRELAKQIFNVAQPYLASVPGLTSSLLVGGSNPAEDAQRLKDTGAHVMVGTPGRLDDVLRRCPALDLRRLELLVLDEADRLLDMGFRKQLDDIMARLPKQRRTGLFSATQTEAVAELARAGLRNPLRVNVEITRGGGGGGAPESGGGAVQKTPSSLRLEYMEVSPEAKLPQLVSFLAAHRDDKVIVYFLTCACVDFYRAVMPRIPQLKGCNIKALFGKMKQAQRERTLQEFAEGSAGVLLATDVAARGLDIPDVTWVLQFDAPQDPDAFVHRVGRTARMGRAGASLALLLPSEGAYVEFLCRRKVPLVEAQPAPDAPDVLPLLRRAAEGEREVMERGVKAFLSYLRGYREHRCAYIFRVQDLQLGRLATAHCLLRIPKVPEVRKAAAKGLQGFTQSAVDPNSVKYKDKAREAHRQRQLAAAAADTPRPAAARAAAAEGEDGGGRDVGGAQDREKHLPAAKRRLLSSRVDVDDLESDYRALRKLKKGKMSEADFDRATGLAAPSSSGSEGGEAGGGASAGAAFGAAARARQPARGGRRSARGSASIAARGKRKKSKRRGKGGARAKGT